MGIKWKTGNSEVRAKLKGGQGELRGRSSGRCGQAK